VRWPTLDQVARHVLMRWLTPLGWIFYGLRLKWAECKLYALQRYDAADPALNEIAVAANKFRSILNGSTV
jgi:hypothetical protein